MHVMTCWLLIGFKFSSAVEQEIEYSLCCPKLTRAPTLHCTELQGCVFYR